MVAGGTGAARSSCVARPVQPLAALLSYVCWEGLPRSLSPEPHLDGWEPAEPLLWGPAWV